MKHQNEQIKQIDYVIDSLNNIKNSISNYKTYIPNGHKIIYIPTNVTKITYTVGRFTVTRNLSGTNENM